MTLPNTRSRGGKGLAWRKAGQRALAAALVLSALTSAPAHAQEILVVRADGGGLLGRRSEKIRALAASGERVELRGTCMSACTMYLSLKNLCIAPDARFGFHGPSWYGKALPPRQFDYWSKLMARHYREPLRSWFMKTGRYQLTGYFQFSGRQLIDLGYPSC